MKILDGRYRGGWNGRGGQIPWPPRSSDLTPPWMSRYGASWRIPSVCPLC